MKYTADGVEYETLMTLNYSPLISDVVKYVTFRTDGGGENGDGYVKFGVDKASAVTVYYVKNAHTGLITGPFNVTDNTDYEEDLAIENGYAFTHWTYEKPDGTILTALTSLSNLDDIRNFIFNTTNSNDELLKQNEVLTSFRFTANAKEAVSTAQFKADYTFKKIAINNLGFANVKQVTAIKTGNAKGYAQADKTFEYTEGITSDYPDILRFYKKGTEIYWYTVDATTPKATNGLVYVSNSCSELFSEWTALKDVSGISNWDFGEVSNMYQMFYNCSSLTNVSFSKPISMKNSNASFFNRIFSGCSNLESVTMEIDTSNVTTSTHAQCKEMFKNCSKLTNVNLSGNFTKIYNFSSMFYGCNALTTDELIRAFGTWKIRTDIDKYGNAKGRII